MFIGLVMSVSFPTFNMMGLKDKSDDRSLWANIESCFFPFIQKRCLVHVICLSANSVITMSNSSLALQSSSWFFSFKACLIQMPEIKASSKALIWSILAFLSPDANLMCPDAAQMSPDANLNVTPHNYLMGFPQGDRGNIRGVVLLKIVFYEQLQSCHMSWIR